MASGTPRAATLGAWEEALEQLAIAEVRPKLSLTPNEFARGISNPALAEPMHELARHATVAQWSVGEPGREVATAAWDDVARIVTSLTRGVSWSTRLRRSLRRRGAWTADTRIDVADQERASSVPVGQSRN